MEGHFFVKRGVILYPNVKIQMVDHYQKVFSTTLKTIFSTVEIRNMLTYKYCSNGRVKPTPNEMEVKGNT